MAQKRNGEIDILRFVFALIVAIHHFGFEYTAHQVIVRGYIGVEFFFLVTGYLMAKKASKNPAPCSNAQIADNTWKFIISKVSSFYPYFLFGFLLTVVSKLFIFKWPITKCISHLIRSIPNLTHTLVGVVAKSDLYISGQWFLSAMILAIFILYPILLKDYNLATKIIFPCISIFLMGYLYNAYSQIIITYTEFTFLSLGLIRAIIEIAIGASLFELTPLVQRLNIHPLLLTILKWGGYSVVFIYALGYTGRSYDIHVMLWCAVGVLLSFSNVGYTIKDTKLTRYLGKISLPIYIYHTIVLRSCLQIYGTEISKSAFLIMYFSAIVLSVIFMIITDFIMKQCRNRGFTLLKKSCE